MKIFNLNYNVIFTPEPEGGFTVTVPSLPGCVSYGKDLKQAKKMAIEAIQLYIQSLQKHGEPIPSDNSSFITSLGVFPKPNPKTRQKIYA